MSQQEERWAVWIDGIIMPGFGTEEEAENYIKKNNLDKKGAVTAKLLTKETTEAKPNSSR